jgi:hypothetical protein
MNTSAPTVMRFEALPGDPEAQPCSRQPEISTGDAVRLRNSTNSSFPPAGPRVRNSEMTISFGGSDCAATGPAVATTARRVSRTSRVSLSIA